MPAFKLTKDLFIKGKLNRDILQKCTENLKDDNLKDELLQALSVENAKEQIEIFKKIAKEIGIRFKTNQSLDEVKLPLEFLVHVFFISTSKNPSRRVLISNFQGLPENVRENVIGPAIKHALLDLCSQPIRTSDSHTDGPISFSNTLDLRHNVDTVAAVIENFLLGEDCVRAVCLEVLTYLGKVQDSFFCSYGNWLSPVQQNEVMHHCLETVKLANRICQKSSVTMETKLREEMSADIYRKTVSQFVSIIIKILHTDDFLLDCKTTSAMNIWLMLKYCLDTDHLVYLASKSMFMHVDWIVKSCDETKQLPDWLQDLSIDQLSRSKVTSSAYLCSCYGFLAMVAMETLLHSMNGKCMLLDILLQEFLESSKSCSDVGSKLLAAKSVCFLTQKIRDYCSQGHHIPVEIQRRLLGDSEDMKAILEFVWTAWEDSVDAIRFTVKDVFENVVAIHVHLNRHTATVKDDPLLHQLAMSILNDVSWSCKGKYPTLSVLVGHLGSTRMLLLHPGIAAEILQQMQEQTLACYASGLYEKMFRSHKDELETDQSGSSVWFRQWLEPVLTVLCESNVLQKKHTIEYILPKLLKVGTDTLQYIIQRLSALSGNKQVHIGSQENHKIHMDNSDKEGGELGALIICLRRARALGLLKPELGQSGVDCSRELWCGVVHVHLLRQALVCKDDQIRIDAFALLCENQKTSETISDIELRLIRYFIPQNLNNQNPAFRQHFLSLLKKFLSRMKESNIALKRKSCKDKTAVENMEQYKVFLDWLTRCLFSMLYPGSVFARRTTCLGALSLLKESFGGQNKCSDAEYNFYECVTQHDLNTLIFCLTDTFEDNKMEAASLLIACAKNTTSPVLGESVVKELLDISLSLSQSTRPQDSTTAAYLLSVLTHQHNMHNVLTQHIETNLAGKHNSNLELDVTEHKTEGKVDDNDKEVIEIETLHRVLRDGKDSELVRSYTLLMILMRNLESQTETAKTSLIVAAANRPLYPTIQCMRYCFADVKYRTITKDSVDDWRELVARFIKLCFEISGVVSPVVCNSSPEGNVPLDAVAGMGNLEDRDSENLSKSKETVMLMPEYLIVCCWRSVKEISLLLGQLTATLPISGAESDHGLLTYDQVIQVGDFFTTLLLESKHRGAFELAYAGFVKVTDMLWRSSDPELHQLPRRWLSEVMVDIKSNDPESRLCATRRSAGVPFYVQALVTTEPSSTGRQCFRQTMQELLTLAFNESVVTQDKCTAKVHALNILRAMYKDSRLRDDVAPFVADGLKVAILGFKSPLWAVRNSATLLMTAMMTRIFGVKRSKDETTFSRKNCQTGRTFFYNYPSLYQFLLEQIAMATEHVTSQLHPGLFPILMVLGRLFPSAMEGTDTSLNLAAFIPYVVKCSANPVLKTREMAAKALQPLVEKDQVTSVFQELLTLLPCQPTDIMRQNQIHGALLQISQLCKTIPLLPSSGQSKLSTTLSQMWSGRMDVLISRHNRCLATRMVALDITSSFIQQFANQNNFIGILSDIVSEEIQSLDTAYDPCTPALSEFQTTVCKLYCDTFLSTGGVRHSSEILPSETLDTVKDVTSDRKSVDVVNKITNDEQNVGGKALWCDKSISDEDKKSCAESESVILKCLKSKSYEVRKTVLEKLRKMLPDILKAEGASDDGTQSPSSDGKSLGNGLLVKIYPYLLAMLNTEDHEECKIELLGLLEQWFGHHIISGRKMMTLVQSVQRILLKLSTQTYSDKLTASVITFAGVAVSQMFKMELPQTHSSSSSSSPQSSSSSTAGSKGDHSEADLVTMATLVAKFVSVIRGYTEAMETSSEILLACAQALLQNGASLLGTSPSVFLQNTDYCMHVDVLRSVLDLLQADDIDVRETAAFIVYNMSPKDVQVHGHPYIALTDLLDHCISHGRLAENKEQFLRLLFEMMLEEKEDSQDHEERLFDRGEMNTYWDELDFIQVLDAAIMRCVQPDRHTQQPFKQMKSDDSAKTFTGQLHHSEIVKALVENYFHGGHVTKADDSKLAADDTGLTFRDIFFNSPSYQKSVLSLYKTLIMCKYGSLLNSGVVLEVSLIVKQTVEKLKDYSDKNVWPPVLHDLLLKL